jgi:HMG (high mobility group) box
MNRPEHVIYSYQRIDATTIETNEVGDNALDAASEKMARIPTNLIVPTRDDLLQNVEGRAIVPHGDLKKSGSIETLSTVEPIEKPMPKRNLSAYNLFFQVERENIINDEEGMNYTYENVARVAARHYLQGKQNLPRRKHRKTHGKITFAELARSIASKWKALDPSSKALFMERTYIEKERYQREIAEWADRRLQSQSERGYSSLMVSAFHTTAEQQESVTAPLDHLESLSDEIMPHRVFPPTSPQARPMFASALGTAPASMFQPATHPDQSGAATREEMAWRNPTNLYDYGQSQHVQSINITPVNFPHMHPPMRQQSQFQQIQQPFAMVQRPESTFTNMQSYPTLHNSMGYPTMRSSTQSEQMSTMSPSQYSYRYPPVGNVLASNAAVVNTQTIMQRGSTDGSEQGGVYSFNEYKSP